MPELFIYLIKVNIVLVLFYLAYRFLLRPLTFYTLNRFFLVFAIIFSTVYPFADLSTLFEKNREFISPQVINVIPDWQPTIIPAAVLQNNSRPVAETFNYWIIPEAIFWLGVLIMSLRLLIQLYSLYHLHKSSVAQTLGYYSYRNIKEAVNPFSFLKNTYLNASQLKPAELESVLEHEQVHVKEWHTLDVLLSELNIIFYWFNPGAWLIKRAVKENLEYIADFRILQQGADSIAYQYDLLNVSLLKQSSPLVNHFSLLTIKNRIIMINRQRSSQLQITRYMLTLPLVVLLALVFTVSKAQLEKRDISKGVTKSVLKPITEISVSKTQLEEKDTSKVSTNSIPKPIIERREQGRYRISSQTISERVELASNNMSVSMNLYENITKPLIEAKKDTVRARRASLVDIIRFPANNPVYIRQAALDKQGNVLYDSIMVETEGSKGSGSLNHGHKVAFIVDGSLYNEEQFQKLDLDKISKIRMTGTMGISDNGQLGNPQSKNDRYFPGVESPLYYGVIWLFTNREVGEAWFNSKFKK